MVKGVFLGDYAIEPVELGEAKGDGGNVRDEQMGQWGGRGTGAGWLGMVENAKEEETGQEDEREGGGLKEDA